MTQAATLTLLAIGMSSPLLALLAFVRRKRRLVLTLLATRERLDSTAFGERYFCETPAPAKLAAEVRDMLAHHLPFPVEGLRPDDRLFDDLWMHQWSHLAIRGFLIDVSGAYSLDLDGDILKRGTSFRMLVDGLEARLNADVRLSGAAPPS
jgi:hypothetical protein